MDRQGIQRVGINDGWIDIKPLPNGKLEIAVRSKSVAFGFIFVLLPQQANKLIAALQAAKKMENEG